MRHGRREPSRDQQQSTAIVRVNLPLSKRTPHLRGEEINGRSLKRETNVNNVKTTTTTYISPPVGSRPPQQKRRQAYRRTTDIAIEYSPAQKETMEKERDVAQRNATQPRRSARLRRAPNFRAGSIDRSTGRTHLGHQLGLRLAEGHELPADVAGVDYSVFLGAGVLDHHDGPIQDGLHQLVALRRNKRGRGGNFRRVASSEENMRTKTTGARGAREG